MTTIKKTLKLKYQQQYNTNFDAGFLLHEVEEGLHVDDGLPDVPVYGTEEVEGEGKLEQ